jgi:hypothetical protein
MRRIVAVVVVVWLVIGVGAAVQRNYVTGSAANCARAATIAVTILAGPFELRRRQPDDQLLGAATVESTR